MKGKDWLIRQEGGRGTVSVSCVQQHNKCRLKRLLVFHIKFRRKQALPYHMCEKRLGVKTVRIYVFFAPVICALKFT